MSDDDNAYAMHNHTMEELEQQLAAVTEENAKLKALIANSNLEEVDGYAYDNGTLKKAGRILSPKDSLAKEQQHSKDLQALAACKADNANLRELLKRVDAYFGHCCHPVTKEVRQALAPAEPKPYQRNELHRK